MDPEAHRIRGTPPGTSAYLLEDWCTPAEETYFLGRVYRGASGASGGWTQLSGRRLQNHGGVAHEKGMIPTKMPDWLEKHIPEVQRACGALMPAHINHVLVNEYRAGEGIMPHQDGPLYTPAVAIASLGCGATMRFTPHRGVADDGAAHPKDADADADAASFGVWLPPRSLLLFDGTLYDSYLHGIDFASEDRLDDSIVNRERAAALVGGAETAPREATRVSLTFRNVRKVRNALKLFR